LSRQVFVNRYQIAVELAEQVVTVALRAFGEVLDELLDHFAVASLRALAPQKSRA